MDEVEGRSHWRYAKLCARGKGLGHALDCSQTKQRIRKLKSMAVEREKWREHVDKVSKSSNSSKAPFH